MPFENVVTWSGLSISFVDFRWLMNWMMFHIISYHSNEIFIHNCINFFLQFIGMVTEVRMRCFIRLDASSKQPG